MRQQSPTVLVAVHLRTHRQDRVAADYLMTPGHSPCCAISAGLAEMVDWQDRERVALGQRHDAIHKPADEPRLVRLAVGVPSAQGVEHDDPRSVLHDMQLHELGQERSSSTYVLPSA